MNMASTKGYLDFILEQLSELDGISWRAMMGEYILYDRGRVFGGIYDDRLLVKPVRAALRLMPDAPLELPHVMLLIDDPERTVIEPLEGTVRRKAPLYDCHRQGYQ